MDISRIRAFARDIFMQKAYTSKQILLAFQTTIWLYKNNILECYRVLVFFPMYEMISM